MESCNDSSLVLQKSSTCSSTKWTTPRRILNRADARAFLDLILQDLGSPFLFESDTVRKAGWRHTDVPRKGHRRGNRNTIRFVIGVDVEAVANHHSARAWRVYRGGLGAGTLPARFGCESHVCCQRPSACKPERLSTSCALRTRISLDSKNQHPL
jgi:hypothetical protein